MLSMTCNTTRQQLLIEALCSAGEVCIHRLSFDISVLHSNAHETATVAAAAAADAVMRAASITSTSH